MTVLTDPVPPVPAPTADRLPLGIPGRVQISAPALRRLAAAIVSERIRVPAGEVSVALADANGELRVSVDVPLVLDGRGTIAERAASLRERVVERMGRLGGRTVGRVDVRFSHVHRGNARRVR